MRKIQTQEVQLINTNHEYEYNSDDENSENEDTPYSFDLFQMDIIINNADQELLPPCSPILIRSHAMCAPSRIQGPCVHGEKQQ